MKQHVLAPVAVLGLVYALSSSAQEVWRTPDGKPLPETSSRRSKNGLGVSLVITSDSNWQSKWETPSHETPNFTGATTVSVGGRLTILTFVVNPKTDSLGNLNVLSHIQVTRPNGTSSVDAPGLRCLLGKLQGPATNVRLCEAAIQFSADPGDLEGIWRVKVTVQDENRGTEIAVEDSFRLQAQ